MEVVGLRVQGILTERRGLLVVWTRTHTNIQHCARNLDSYVAHMDACVAGCKNEPEASCQAPLL